MTVPNVQSGGERGLLSMAVAPDYATSGLFYVYYTRNGDGAIQVDEFHRDASNPDLGDPSTRRAVIIDRSPFGSNHNGGQLQFGPDGMLYMGTGDGGGGGDPYHTGQDLRELRGKIIRIDPRQDGAKPYTVPANNPFVSQAPWKPEIWSYGRAQPVALLVRPPDRRLHARRRGSGHLGGDRLPPDQRRVGARRELRLELHGGAASVRGTAPSLSNHTPPVFEYQHGSTARARSQAATSAAIRRFRALFGRYVYADYCGGPDLVERARDPGRDRQPRGDGHPDGVATHLIRRGLVRPHVRHGPGQRGQRVPDSPAGSARAVLHSAVPPRPF